MAANHTSGNQSVTKPDDLEYDVVIIGAGIAGINAAYHLRAQGPPGFKFVILEGRDCIGGTWDLFRFPGMRSDSDIFTFGFQWSPWGGVKNLATRDEILKYLDRSVKSAGIDPYIRFRHKVIAGDWRSAERRWAFQVDVAGKEKPVTYKSRFVLVGTGYYDYETPRQTVIPGIENFGGKVLHPQFWPQDYDYSGKDVVIIGSGATTITLLPAMAEKAKSVTMLQRSPSYVVSLPSTSPVTTFLFAFLPAFLAHTLLRMFWIFRSSSLKWFARANPERVKNIIKTAAISQLPPNINWDPHFKPHYNPFDQRTCACMDGDFYAAFRSGKANVVTDKIKTVTSKSIELESGSSLHPDVIVTATGLKVKFGGGIQFSIDGQPFKISDKYAWRASLLEDVPNLAFMFGYADASWTLGTEISTTIFIRLLREMEKRKANVVVARPSTPMPVKPMMDLTSTYLKTADQVFPKGGTGLWSPKVNYMVDIFWAKWGSITEDLHFS